MPRDSQTGLYHEEYFNEILALEKKRCERSKDPVCLITADLSSFVDIHERQKIAKSMVDVLSEVTRDADVKGWHVFGHGDHLYRDGWQRSDFTVRTGCQ